MAKNVLQKVICITLCIFLIYNINIISVYASAEEDAKTIRSFTEVGYEIDEETGEVISTYAFSYPMARGTILEDVHVCLTLLPSGKINLYGYTDAHKVVDSVRLSIMLDRKTSINGAWVQVAAWENIEAVNAHTVEESLDIYPSSGTYYYRLRGLHSAYDNGVGESMATTTGEVAITR